MFAVTADIIQPDKPVEMAEFGLLRQVALLPDLETARAVCARLRGIGIRATVGTGRDGFVRVLVFADQYKRAADAV